MGFILEVTADCQKPIPEFDWFEGRALSVEFAGLLTLGNTRQWRIRVG
jgi:hypothetical protein